MTDEVIGERKNAIGKSKEKNQKSTKTPAMKRDDSQINGKKKKALIQDYGSIVVQRIAINKKQPTTLCVSMSIVEFLDQIGEKYKVVVEEENELDQADFEKE